MYDRYSGKNKMSSLYEDFLQTEGDWTKSMILKTIKSITRNGRRGIRRWQTRSQLINHFGDTKIVDSVIARKETDEHLRKTEMRKHPDCPGASVPMHAFIHMLCAVQYFPIWKLHEFRRTRAVPRFDG